jgi:hypothetical protein
MGAALYIVPERQIENFDIFVNGKALSHYEGMDDLAERAGVRPLMDFFSQNPEDLAEILEDDDLEEPESGLPAEQWFSADDGLATVRGLLSHLISAPSDRADDVALINDLREYESILTRLAAEGIRWHLAVDY